MPKTNFFAFKPNQELKVDKSYTIEFSEEDSKRFEYLSGKNFFFNEAERDKIYIMKALCKESENSEKESETYEIVYGFYDFNKVEK